MAWRGDVHSVTLDYIQQVLACDLVVLAQYWNNIIWIGPALSQSQVVEV